jgi:hypothetical protein
MSARDSEKGINISGHGTIQRMVLKGIYKKLNLDGELGGEYRLQDIFVEYLNDESPQRRNFPT